MTSVTYAKENKMKLWLAYSISGDPQEMYVVVLLAAKTLNDAKTMINNDFLSHLVLIGDADAIISEGRVLFSYEVILSEGQTELLRIEPTK